MGEPKKIIWREYAEDLIYEGEGVRFKPYRDSEGILTIGVGRNLEGVKFSADEKATLREHGQDPSKPESLSLTPPLARMLFDNDIRRAIAEARRFAGDRWECLSDERKAVLVDMAFNLGPRLRGFKKMQAALQCGDYLNAAAELRDSNYYWQVKTRGVRNYDIMRTGRMKCA